MTGKLTSVGSDALNWIARSVSSALDSKNLRVEVRPIGTPRRVGVTCSAMATPTVTVSDAISAPAPLRADATIVSDGVVAALGTVKVAVNGAVVSAGSATPLTVNRTLATPRPVLARASIGSWLFSVTDRPLTGFADTEVAGQEREGQRRAQRAAVGGGQRVAESIARSPTRVPSRRRTRSATDWSA